MKKTKKHNKIFLSFLSARKIIHKLKISSQSKWWKYASSKRPPNIPSTPYEIYKEWKGWCDWLGHEKKKYKVNEHYFNKWSHNMSYILGFWWTDGNTDGISRFNISQEKDNIYILKQILKEIESNHPIKLYKNMCSIDIYSNKLIKDITKLGGIPRKSLKINFPFIPLKYLPDFILGLWDGDGSVWYCKNKNAYLANFCSGSFTLIKDLHKTLKNNIGGIKGRIRSRIVKKGNKINGRKIKKDSLTYRLEFGVNDTRRLRDFIYNGKSDLKIIRKYKKFHKAGKINLSRNGQKFLSYRMAKNLVRKLKLKNSREWHKWIKNNWDKKIPVKPEQHYGNWTNWYNWLGKTK
jgi:hypothetical protein